MLQTENELLHFLNDHQIPFQYIAHPAVYTCEQAEKQWIDLPGVSTKNLFLRDEKHRFYLAVTACSKRLDLKQLSRGTLAPKLNFGSEPALQEYLGVTAGAVTVLGLVNDIHHAVTLWVDADIWYEPFFLCHPLVNTATLVIGRDDLLRFFSFTGHQPQVVTMPRRATS